MPISHLQKEFVKNLSENNDLYVQSDTILQAGLFHNFPIMCLEICGFDPHFLFVPG